MAVALNFDAPCPVHPDAVIVGIYRDGTGILCQYHNPEYDDYPEDLKGLPGFGSLAFRNHLVAQEVVDG